MCQVIAEHKPVVCKWIVSAAVNSIIINHNINLLSCITQPSFFYEHQDKFGIGCFVFVEL